MKKIVIILSMIMGLFFFGTANATTDAPAWVCQLKGNMSGSSFGLLVGFQRLKGYGSINCESPTGQRRVQAVSLEMTGLGLGIGFSQVDSIQVFTAGIGVMNGPSEFYGKYNVGASTGATLIAVGASADLAVTFTRGGLGFEAGLTGRKARGLEGHLHATTFSIRAHSY